MANEIIYGKLVGSTYTVATKSTGWISFGLRYTREVEYAGDTNAPSVDDYFVGGFIGQSGGKGAHSYLKEMWGHMLVKLPSTTVHILGKTHILGKAHIAGG